jgi:hypothetical protein
MTNHQWSAATTIARKSRIKPIGCSYPMRIAHAIAFGGLPADIALLLVLREAM